MNKITDIFKNKQKTFSFEIFPPKTDKGMDHLQGVLDELTQSPFDFVSVTYGAGGSSRDTTTALVCQIQNKYAIPVIHHFTCVLHTKNQIKDILDQLKRHNIRSLLALRGDPPKDNLDWVAREENFKYSSELVAFIRQEYGDYFSIGVAGFPEGHPLAKNKDIDADVLKKKVDAGGDFVMTQLFFDNEFYFEYVKRLKERNITARVIPGILPITNYESVVNFCQNCKAVIPQRVHDIFSPIASDQQKTYQAGIQFAFEQCKELLEKGAKGIHFYTLNKTEPVKTIMNLLKQESLV